MSSKYARCLNPRTRKTIAAHRAIWVYYRGIIPVSFELHHIDGNPRNNNLANLQLVKHQDHLRMHSLNYKQAKGKWFKRCCDCGKVKPVDTDFYKNTKPNSTQPRCKPCHNAHTLARYHTKRAALIHGGDF